MAHTIASRLAVGLLAAVFGLTLAACEPTNDGSGGGRPDTAKSCDLRPDSPHVSHHRLQKTKETVINAVVRVVCDVPPESHKLTVTLQLADGRGGWKNKFQTTYTDIPPKLGKRYPATWEGCAGGVWRTHARATGTLQGKPFSFEDTSRELKVDPKECQ